MEVFLTVGVQAASFLLQTSLIVFLLLLLNRWYHVRTLWIIIQLSLELFIKVFDKILIRLFQRARTSHSRNLISLRYLRMKWERLNLFIFLFYEVRLCTDQSSRNFLIQNFKAELRSLSHLEFLIVLIEFNFFPLPGLNSFRNNFYHSDILFLLLHSSTLAISTLDISLPFVVHGTCISLVGIHVMIIPGSRCLLQPNRKFASILNITLIMDAFWWFFLVWVPFIYFVMSALLLVFLNRLYFHLFRAILYSWTTAIWGSIL